MGSPLLLVWHAPPKPLHRVLPAAGPYRSAPVVLSKTAKDRLTHSTTCVAPTAALVSGGATFTEKPENPIPSPKKLRPEDVATSGAPALWRTGSICSGA